MQCLADCAYFTTERYDLAGNMEYMVGEESFACILMLEGDCVLAWQEETLPLQRGDCVFVPAGLGKLELSGKGQLLLTTV